MSDAPEDAAAARERLEELQEAAAALRAYGEDAGIPAVEHGAARIEDDATTLAANLPPELVGKED